MKLTSLGYRTSKNQEKRRIYGAYGTDVSIDEVKADMRRRVPLSSVSKDFPIEIHTEYIIDSEEFRHPIISARVDYVAETAEPKTAIFRLFMKNMKNMKKRLRKVK